MNECIYCHGTGFVEVDLECINCDGSGLLPVLLDSPDAYDLSETTDERLQEVLKITGGGFGWDSYDDAELWAYQEAAKREIEKREKLLTMNNTFDCQAARTLTSD